MTTSRLAQQRVLQQLTRHPTFRQLHQTTRPSFRTRPNSTYSAFQKTLVRATRNISTWYTAFARSQRRIPNFRSAFRRQASSTAETENPSLSQRLKKLSREYGWSALGVYLALSAADFPFCFLAVRLVGADTIGHYEHVVVHWFKDLVSWPVSEEAGDRVEDGAKHAVEKVQTTVEEATGREKKVLEMDEAYEVTDHGYKDAEKANSGANASEYTSTTDVANEMKANVRI